MILHHYVNYSFFYYFRNAVVYIQFPCDASGFCVQKNFQNSGEFKKN